MARSLLVTGSAGGLGSATAAYFAARGWTVYAADLVPVHPEPGIVPVTMDVTDPESCTAAATLVAGQVPGLHAVVNFAGILELGPMVEIEPARMRRSLEINVFGTFCVNQAFFALVRSGGGRIVNVSSEAGVSKPQPISAPYSVTKHAVEAYSDVLRRELMFLGIPVVVVEPGPFRTPMSGSITDKLMNAVRPGSPFEPLVRKVRKVGARSEGKAQPPEVLAAAVWEAVTATRPRMRYLVGSQNYSRLFDALPDRTIDRIVRRFLH